MMKERSLSTCPVVFSLDIFGDKWSLVILRDVMFAGKSHFREFLASNEKIASNILSARLELLVREGLLIKDGDPSNRSAVIYRPTQKALDLYPMFVELMRWGAKHKKGEVHPAALQVLADPDGWQAMIEKRLLPR
jgi:DNA-binding HxlR family transcriptional regulator